MINKNIEHKSKPKKSFIKKLNRKQILNIIWVILLLLNILTISRYSIAGQFLDDVFYRFLFGWLKFPIYILTTIFIIDRIFKIKLISKLWKKINKSRLKKSVWIFINIIWSLSLFGAIFLVVTTKENWLDLKEYFPNKLIVTYFEQWKKTSILETAAFDNIFKYWTNFVNVYETGGMFGFLLVSITSLTTIIGSILLNLISWTLFINYAFFNHIFYFLLSQTKKEVINWKNLNHKKKYRLETNFINEIADQDITIELQRAKKIYLSEMENDTRKQNTDIPKKETSINATNIISNDEINEFSTSTKARIKEDEWEIPNQKENNTIKKESIQKENEKDSDKKKKLIEAPVNEAFENSFNLKVDQKTLTEIDFKDQFKEINFRNFKLNQTIAEINKQKIINLLNEYNVQAQVKNYKIASQITTYAISLNEGTKVQDLLSLEPELKLKLISKYIRFQTSVFDQALIGLEIPNKERIYISCKENLSELKFNSNELLLNLGKTLNQKNFIIDLKKLPHLLISGVTGGGKSICLQNLITNLIYQNDPQNLKLLLIDPKRVDLFNFQKIPHLICNIVNDPEKVINKLQKVFHEVNRRYQKLQELQSTNLSEYNQKVETEDKIPYLVIIIDELADLMMNFPKQMENLITRISQKARAVGVHMILATQRPSVKIITGLIKSNLPARIAFQVTNHFDSQTIINQKGAEKLLGKGDMLFQMPGKENERIQGPFINAKDIETLTSYWIKKQSKQSFWKEFDDLDNNFNFNVQSFEKDTLYEEIKNYCSNHSEHISISLLQRKFRIGFNRAGRIWDQLVEEGIIEKK